MRGHAVGISTQRPNGAEVILIGAYMPFERERRD